MQTDVTTDFGGRTAFVTGGGSGIGRAAALLFARHGARVAVVELDAAGATETVHLIRAAGGDAEFLAADLARESEVRQAVERCVARFGGLDCAFNNAGICPPAGPFHELDGAEWERVIAVDLSAVFYCMKHQIRHMLAHGGGAIVNTSSGAGVTPAPDARGRARVRTPADPRQRDLPRRDRHADDAREHRRAPGHRTRAARHAADRAHG